MNQWNHNIVPECYADTLLVEMLGFKKPNHALNSNMSNVLKTVRNSRPNQRIVGIIDEDKGKGEKLLNGFERVAEQHNIKKYVSGNQTILIICPAFESWIYQNANVLQVALPFASQQVFQKACKRIDVSGNQQVRKFLNNLKQKNAPGFTQLKTWICEGAGIDEKEL